MTVFRSDEGKDGVMRRNWTEGGIGGNLWSLAWPMTISSTIMMLGPVIDMIWIGRLGPASIAGVGTSGLAVMLINSLIMGLFTGLRAMVARFVGAGDEKSANHVAQQALVIGIGISIVLAAVGMFLAEPILELFGIEPDVVAEGAAYMRIQLVGIFTMSFWAVAQGVMQASGDARTPMKIGVSVRILHIVLSPFLIFGWWLFPQLGVSGSALTGVITQGIGGALGLWVLFSGHTRLRMTLKNYRFDRNIIWRILKVGVPASLTGIHMNVGNVVFLWFIAPFGTLAVAGHTLVSRVDNFVFMPAMGLGQAAGILAAQNLGAGHPERSAKTAWTAVGWFTGVMCLFSLVFWFWAKPVVGIFSQQPELMEIASMFLKIQIASYLMNGLMMVLMNCLNSVGDTFVAMVVDLVTMWGVRVPLAIILPGVGGLGVYGIRWALVADTISSSLAFVVYFLLGRWKKKKI